MAESTLTAAPAPTTTTTAPMPKPDPTPVPTSTTAGARAEPTAAPAQVDTTAPAPATTAGTATGSNPPAPQPGQVPVAPTAPAPIPTAEPVSNAPEAETALQVEEPQNPLTQKFTDAEWKSLKEFRTQLPDIFAEAYPDNPKAKETPISLWGVDIDPTNPASDARVSVVLLKFLRARHLNVNEGRSMLVNTLRWRDSFNIKAACEEEFPTEVFGGLGKVYGKDKGGRPVVYNIYGGTQDLKAAFGDVQRFLRWRVALMEQSVAQLDFINVDQTLQIHDYEGVSLTSRDANSKAAASEATNIFQSHYPELLYHKLFINVPTLLAWIFWAFKPLISAETIKKMEVVGTGKGTVRRALGKWIEEDEVEGRYR